MKTELKKLTAAGFLAALGLVLGRSFCTVYLTESFKITLDKVPVLLAGIWLGPVYGALVAAVSDIIGAAALSPYGWTPLLTVSPVLMGVISGVLAGSLLKSDSDEKKIYTVLKTAIIIVITETLTSLLLQTLFLTILYGSTYTARLTLRLPVCGAVAFAEAVIISGLRCSNAISGSMTRYINKEKRRR